MCDKNAYTAYRIYYVTLESFYTLPKKLLKYVKADVY